MSNTVAWDKFERFMKEARAKIEDDWAPVALICLKATPETDGSFTLKPDPSILLWPASFPEADRAGVLERVAATYRDGRQHRLHHGKIE